MDEVLRSKVREFIDERRFVAAVKLICEEEGVGLLEGRQMFDAELEGYLKSKWSGLDGEKVGLLLGSGKRSEAWRELRVGSGEANWVLQEYLAYLDRNNAGGN